MTSTFRAESTGSNPSFSVLPLDHGTVDAVLPEAVLSAIASRGSQACACHAPCMEACCFVSVLCWFVTGHLPAVRSLLLQCCMHAMALRMWRPAHCCITNMVSHCAATPRAANLLFRVSHCSHGHQNDIMWVRLPAQNTCSSNQFVLLVTHEGFFVACVLLKQAGAIRAQQALMLTALRHGRRAAQLRRQLFSSQLETSSAQAASCKLGAAAAVQLDAQAASASEHEGAASPLPPLIAVLRQGQGACGWAGSHSHAGLGAAGLHAALPKVRFSSKGL